MLMKIGLNSYIWTLSDMKNWKKHQKHKFTKPLFAPYLQKLCLYDQKWHWLLGSLFKVLNPDNKRRSDNVLWPFSERSGPSDNVQWTFIERSWLSGKQLIKNWNFLQQKNVFVTLTLCHTWKFSHIGIYCLACWPNLIYIGLGPTHKKMRYGWFHHRMIFCCK